MKGYINTIEGETLSNEHFRQVLYTAQHCQLVVMSIPVGGEIGEEVHEDGDQFLRIEAGSARVIIGEVEQDIGVGFVAIVPSGVRHNVINTSPSEALKLYTLYAPPHHKDKMVHATKQEAENDDEHFDGQVTGA